MANPEVQAVTEESLCLPVDGSDDVRLLDHPISGESGVDQVLRDIMHDELTPVQMGLNPRQRCHGPYEEIMSSIPQNEE